MKLAWCLHMSKEYSGMKLARPNNVHWERCIVNACYYTRDENWRSFHVGIICDLWRNGTQPLATNSVSSLASCKTWPHGTLNLWSNMHWPWHQASYVIRGWRQQHSEGVCSSPELQLHCRKRFSRSKAFVFSFFLCIRVLHNLQWQTYVNYR